jgi:hypothetical protein
MIVDDLVDTFDTSSIVLSTNDYGPVTITERGMRERKNDLLLHVKITST